MKKEVKLNYLSFMTPDFLYVPFDDKESLKLQKNKKVYCGAFLGTFLNLNKIYSPVSGSLIGAKSLMTSKGMSEVLIIENDYKDKKHKLCGSKKDITSFKKEDAKLLLEEINLNRDFTNKKYLLINISYDKKKDLADMFLVSENVQKFLEAADALFTIFGLKKVIFFLNSKDKITLEELSKYMGSYIDMEINIISNNLKDSQLAKSMFGKKANECVVYNAFELFEIYNILKNNKVTTEKFITIYGNKIEPKALYTKIGVSVEDVLTILKLKTIAKKIFLITSEEEINIEKNPAIITKDVKAIKIV